MKNKIKKILDYILCFSIYICICVISCLGAIKVYKQSQVDFCNYAVDKGFYLEDERLNCSSDYLEYLSSIIKRK